MSAIQPNQPPFRVIILSSKCGGHEMVAAAVKKAIKDHFPQAEFISDVRRGEHAADFLWPLRTGGARLYQCVVEKQWFRVFPWLTKIACQWMTLKRPRLEKELGSLIDEKKPDLVISVVPFINGALLRTASGRRVPVFVIPTDADNEIYSLNWPEKQPLFPH